MKLLHAGNQTEESLNLILWFTKINSEDILKGLMLHLVNGWALDQAAQLSGCKQSNLSRAVDKLEAVTQQIELKKEYDYKLYGYKAAHLTDINKV